MRAWTERIALRHVSSTPRFVRLREPQGGDELALEGTDTRAAVQLLDRLLNVQPTFQSMPAAAFNGLANGQPSGVDPSERPSSGATTSSPRAPSLGASDAAPGGGAGDLSASDRDALLAALHRGLWGDRIVASLKCTACAAMYDLSFELSALQRRLLEQCEVAHAEAPRLLKDKDGRQFRLPGAADEEAAAQSGMALGRNYLLASITGREESDLEATCARLEALAPLLDVDLDSTCAECGRPQLVRFDVQSFVLQRLLDERDAVMGEVHALASGYRWSLADILALPRSLRRSLVFRLTRAAAFA